VDGGVLDGVSVSNLVVEGTRSPLFIRLADRARPHRPDAPRPGVGKLRNVRISNIQVRSAGQIGCSITGIPGHPVENVTLDGVDIALACAGGPEHVGREIPESPDSYPEGTMWGPLPAHGFFIRHARGVRLRGVRVTPADGEPRPMLVTEDVEGPGVTPDYPSPP
jgi:hypothetical protein